MRPFGMSTHLFHGRQLTRDHLKAVAAHGFDEIELFATRTHFDYHSSSRVADLQQSLAEAQIALHSVHAPVSDGFIAGRHAGPLTLASTDTETRARALAEVEHALQIARRIPFKVLVVHLGIPRSQPSGPSDNNRDAARRSIEALQKSAEPLGVRIALEVIPNELSRTNSLVHFIDTVIDATDVGVCLDVGHAHLEGSVVDAVEGVSEHLVAVHLHDNRGRTDDHLMPFDGTIDWPAALTAVQKVGYDGTFMLEVTAHGSDLETLKRARAARQKMEQLLASW
jgi:sugar phosphate isomerase/epimerase